MEKYLTATTPAEEAVKNYILNNATDALKEKIKASGKNVPDCLQYVANQVQQKARGGCYIGSNEEVYGLCIHYFEEDSIEKGSVPTVAKVTTQPQVVEKIEIPKKAKAKKEPKAKETENVGYKQLSLFDF